MSKNNLFADPLIVCLILGLKNSPKRELTTIFSHLQFRQIKAYVASAPDQIWTLYIF